MTTRLSSINPPPPRTVNAYTPRYAKGNESLGETTNPSPVANGEGKIIMKYGLDHKLGQRPRLMQYILYINGDSSEKYNSIIGNKELLQSQEL